MLNNLILEAQKPFSPDIYASIFSDEKYRQVTDEIKTSESVGLDNMFELYNSHESRYLTNDLVMFSLDYLAALEDPWVSVVAQETKLAIEHGELNLLIASSLAGFFYMHKIPFLRGVDETKPYLDLSFMPNDGFSLSDFKNRPTFGYKYNIGNIIFAPPFVSAAYYFPIRSLSVIGGACAGFCIRRKTINHEDVNRDFSLAMQARVINLARVKASEYAFSERDLALAKRYPFHSLDRKFAYLSPNMG